LDREGDPDSDFTPIILVERGSCSFIRKAKHVQEIGGALALVMDNQDQDPENIVMVDDGTAYEIAIPTILISRSDGEKIKQIILDTESENKGNQKKEFVVLMINFEMENPDDRVEYDIWYTSGDSHALNFLKHMYHYNDKLGDNVLMTPHMIVKQCYHCTDETDNCIRYYQTYYCAPYTDSILQARTALKQGVEELCIYDAYNQTGNSKNWWEYMKELYNCKDSDYNEHCIKKAQDKVKVDQRKLQECKGNEMEILRREQSAWSASGIPYSPAVVINNRVYRVKLFNKKI